MARQSWDEKQDEIINKTMNEPGFWDRVNKPFFQAGGSRPYYEMTPRRNPNDPVDTFVAGLARRALPGSPDVPTEGAAIPSHTPWSQQPVFSGSRSAMALNPNYPGTYGLGRKDPAALPTFLEQPSHRPSGMPENPWEEKPAGKPPAWPMAEPGPREAIPGTGRPTPAALPEDRTQGMELVANRGPAKGYSHNPPADQMGNYEYGGTFDRGDGKGSRHVWFWKDPAKANPQQEVITQAMGELSKYLSNPREYGSGYGMNALKILTDLVASQEVGPSAQAERGLKGAQALSYGAEPGLKGAQGEYYRAKAGAIPADIEETRAKAKYYGRETARPFLVGPGQAAFKEAAQAGDPAIKIAEGAMERPGTAGAVEKMDEFDKMEYLAAANLARTSIDPEIQKGAMATMQEIKKKYAPPTRDRKAVYETLKAKGYKEEDIQERIKELFGKE